LIDGDDVPASSGGTFTRISPAHGIAVGRYADAGEEDVDRAVQAARRTWAHWRHTSGAERAELLTAVAGLIRRDLEELALIEAGEAGKPIRQARGEVESSAGLWEYAATLARHNTGDAHNAL